MKTLSDLFSGFVFGAIILSLVLWGIRHLNPGLPKFGKGKRSAPGGDFVANWIERTLTDLATKSVKAVWNFLKSLF